VGPPALAAPPAPAAAGSITRGSFGSLPWPVAGRLAYRFGRETLPNGTAIRWNGIGIAAGAGTPVRAVASGKVVLASPFEGYGPSVVLDHGGGYYTLYLHLDQLGVREGADVTAGQTVGTVGGQSTPQGPHIEFQLRAPGGQAVDPLPWLRPAGR
jgi:murein hydrolase activator